MKRAIGVLFVIVVGARTSRADYLAPFTMDIGPTASATYGSSDVRSQDGFAMQLGGGIGLGAYVTNDVAIVARARVSIGFGSLGAFSYGFAGATVRYHPCSEWFVEAGPLYGLASNLRDDETAAEGTGLAIDARVGRLFGNLLLGLESTQILVHEEDNRHLRGYDLTLVIAFFSR